MKIAVRSKKKVRMECERKLNVGKLILELSARGIESWVGLSESRRSGRQLWKWMRGIIVVYSRVQDDT